MSCKYDPYIESSCSGSYARQFHYLFTLLLFQLSNLNWNSHKKRCKGVLMFHRGK